MDTSETFQASDAGANNISRIAAARPASEAHPEPATAAKTLEIAVLPGDGIGPEVTTAALRVLVAATRDWRNLNLKLTTLPAGAGEFLRTGQALPPQTFAACQRASAILLGAMGLPNVRQADGRELAPQIDLRERLDLYCGLRPVRLHHASDSPLKEAAAGQIDLLIVRENSEGLFSARHAAPPPRTSDAQDVLKISRPASQRLFRAAFRLARHRRGHVTLVDKANVLPSMVLFRTVFDEIAAEFPDIETDRIYVDAAALYLVQRPQSFDVLVTENMFGDILSDLAAALVGGMGLAPSADLGDQIAMFQPAHGTAPDIAGRNIANPIAAILSAALLLDWLAQPQYQQSAQRIRQAVAAALANPNLRTADLGGRLTTPEMTDAILGFL